MCTYIYITRSPCSEVLLPHTTSCTRTFLAAPQAQSPPAPRAASALPALCPWEHALHIFSITLRRQSRLSTASSQATATAVGTLGPSSCAVLPRLCFSHEPSYDMRGV